VLPTWRAWTPVRRRFPVNEVKIDRAFTQGYHLSRPLDPESMPSYLARHRAVPAAS
jgi:EAL domain-containing protein (putative c-di-GMP-specific phosphodiesterase class I)